MHSMATIVNSIILCIWKLQIDQKWNLIVHTHPHTMVSMYRQWMCSLLWWSFHDVCLHQNIKLYNICNIYMQRYLNKAIFKNKNFKNGKQKAWCNKNGKMKTRKGGRKGRAPWQRGHWRGWGCRTEEPSRPCPCGPDTKGQVSTRYQGNWWWPHPDRDKSFPTTVHFDLKTGFTAGCFHLLNIFKHWKYTNQSLLSTSAWKRQVKMSLANYTDV